MPEAPVLIPERELESLKSKFRELIIKDNYTPEDILSGWKLYEEINAVENFIEGKPRNADWDTENLLTAVEEQGGYALRDQVQAALYRFEERARFDKSGRGAGELVTDIGAPFQEKQAQKFVEAMRKTAQKSIEQIVVNRHGN